MPRLVVRQLLGDPLHDGSEVLLLQGPSDPEATEAALTLRLGLLRKLHQSAGRLAAQVLVLRPLHHAPQGLQRPVATQLRLALVLLKAALRPAVGALHRRFLVLPGIRQRGQLVEGEHDVRPQLVLDLHADLGGEAVLGAVDDAAEVHPVLVHDRHALLLLRDDLIFGDFRVHGEDLLVAHAEAHDLESTGVRVGRSVPVLEGGHAAGLVDDVRAGLQVEVVRVGKDCLRPRGSHLLRGQGLHRRFGCDGDEGGGVDVPVRCFKHTHPALRQSCFAVPIVGVRRDRVGHLAQGLEELEGRISGKLGRVVRWLRVGSGSHNRQSSARPGHARGELLGGAHEGSVIPRATRGKLILRIRLGIFHSVIPSLQVLLIPIRPALTSALPNAPL